MRSHNEVVRSHSEVTFVFLLYFALYHTISDPYTKCSSPMYLLASIQCHTSVAASYMVLYADFGQREHVFSPVRYAPVCPSDQGTKRLLHRASCGLDPSSIRHVHEFPHQSIRRGTSEAHGYLVIAIRIRESSTGTVDTGDIGVGRGKGPATVNAFPQRWRDCTMYRPLYCNNYMRLLKSISTESFMRAGNTVESASCDFDISFLRW